MKRPLLVWLLTLFCVGGAFCNLFANEQSESITVTGVVKDIDGYGIPGVTVTVKFTSLGVLTDLDGNYSIEVPKDKETIVFSFMGLKTQEISIDGKRKIDVEMEEDIESLDEVVVVGYGTQKRVSITGSVTSLKAEELQSTPSVSLATALTGQMPGLVVVQNNGIAGSQSSSINIRGIGTPGDSSPLILVDGIERDFESLDMDEVQNISILKDASATAVYGVKGANGVIIVTTKRGLVQKPRVTFSANYGLIQAAKFVDLMDSYQFATLENEGTMNDNYGAEGTELPWSQEDLDLFLSGEDPYLHSSHNWYDELTNEFGNKHKLSFGLNGGTEKVKYFVSLSYNYERDIFKDYDVDYDDRSNYRRYNVRSNLDFELSPTTQLNINLGGQFADRHQPNTDLSAVSYSMFRTTPMTMSLIDGKLVGRDYDSSTGLQALYDNGYKEVYTNKMQLTATLKQQLSFITQGLSFRANVAYDHSYTSTLTCSKNIPYYLAELDADGEISLRQRGYETKLGSSRGQSTSSKTINFKAFLNYARDFTGGHNVSAVGVFSANSKYYVMKVGGTSLPYSYVPNKYLEYAGRVSYNYNERYFIEGNVGFNGSENFAEAHRFGFFPAVSGGWVLSNEAFFKENNFLNFFKIRGSYGVTGNDKISSDRFFYSALYTMDSGGYKFGDSPTSQGEALEARVGNEDLTWEKSYQKNFALETIWLDSRLKIDADIFYAHREDILLEQQKVSTVSAVALPPDNIGIVDNEGYEVKASWKDKIGKLSYTLRGNYNFAENTYIEKGEINQPYEWMVTTGHGIKYASGLVYEGFLTAEEADIANNNPTADNPASGFAKSTLQAGDMKFKDLNEDGIVDANDMKVFNDITTVPKTTFGFGFDLKYAGWSLSTFFQGAKDVTYTISDRMRMPFFNGYNNAPTYNEDRWTPETADTAKLPRMTASSTAADHNYQNSDFWMKDASYIRLKNAEIAYVFPKSRLKKVGLSSCKVYVNGNNLLTFTDLEHVDPESKSGSKVPIPPNRVYNLGVKVAF